MRVPFEFKFIHASDLHLDSPFMLRRGRDEELRSILLDASIRALVRLCDLAIEQSVDFLVLAGDVYDGIERGVRAELALRRELLRLEAAGIEVFMAFGNHDPVESVSNEDISWPDNLKRFPTQPKTFTIERRGVAYAQVTGVSFGNREERRNLAKLLPDAATDLFSIAVLHSNVGESREHGNYAPSSLSDLVGKGYDYWALGHIHKRTVLSESPLVVYCGNLQGMHMKPSERGLKGAELVKVSPAGVTHEFIPLSQVVFDLVKVDISSCQTLSSVVDRCVDLLRQRRDEFGGVPMVVRLDLCGTLEDEVGRLTENLEAVQYEVISELQAERALIFIDKLDASFVDARSLSDLSSLSDVVVELLGEVKDWHKLEGPVNDYSVEPELRKGLVAKLRKHGLGELLSGSSADVVAAELELVRLLARGLDS